MKAKPDVRSWRFYRSSPRLPVFGIVARVALWGVYALRDWMRLQRFLVEWWFGSYLAGEGQATRLRRTYSGWSLFLCSSWSENVMPLRTARGYLSNGVSGCQGWTNAMERGVLGGECDLELRGSAICWTSSTESTHFPRSTTRVVCWFLKGGVVHCTAVLTVVGTWLLSFLSFFVLSCIRTCALRVELALAAKVVFAGRVIPQQLIATGVWIGKDSIAYDRSTAWVPQ